MGVSYYEQEVAQRWWKLVPGSLLPLSNGGSYQLLFNGRPGGAAGPDVRDAVFGVTQHLLEHMKYQEEGNASADYSIKKRQSGDVEFHVRSSDWVAHQHHTDARYNQVILHVVLICDDPYPTVRQDGIMVPVCSLYDLPEQGFLIPRKEPVWPCQRVMVQLEDEERLRLLRQAGLLRFEQKAHAFVEQLHVAEPMGVSDRYDACLVPALAEGLGYGRDRDFFRAVGIHLLGKAGIVPEPLGRAARPAPLDTARLRVLALLIERWRQVGIWQTLHALLMMPVQGCYNESLQALRAFFCDLELSLARTDILLINVVLPFAVAVGLLERDEALVERAEELYCAHPGLSANRITRMMCEQFQLAREPQGSCQQQGLHYIYQQTCREKRCDVCMVGRKDTIL